MLRKKSLLALLLFLCMVVGILPARVFAAGQYVPENPRWSGYGNQVMWDKPANASGSTYLEYEAQLVLNGQVLQTESVEIDRWVFFDSKNITQSKDAYTLKVRARQIYLTGDPDGSYTVWKRDAWGDWAIGGNTGGGEGPTPPHEHSFGGWKNNGTQHWKECSCGEKSEESPHNFGEWELIYYDVNTKYDVCERQCLTCGYEQIDRYREHQHYYTDDWRSGSTTHWKVCYYCKEVNQDTVADHTFGDWTITKEPTTTETGSRERTCSVCKYKQTETLPVHTHDVHDEAWKYDETEHWQECSCGEKLNVANHAYGEWRVTKPATETEAGSRERDCTVCDHVQTETIPMLEHEHIYGDWQSNDTQHWKECRCGEKIEVGDHTYGEWKITKEPTTTETGSRERTCSTCNYKDREILPVHKHSHNNKWEKDDAQHWRLCSCGEKFDIADHSFDNWTITKEPTTTETGSRERTCSICKYTQTETLPVHTHDVHDEAWKYDKTQHWQECSCGEKLNVANHAYGEWRVTKPATETEEGSKARDCTVCDHVQTETIPMLEHEHIYGDWQSNDTQHWKECRCGEKIEVGDHTYGEWKITKEPTTTETGSRERTCSTCNYKDREILPVHKHSHNNKWEKDDAQHWRLCSCGEKFDIADHSFDNWTITKEPTTTETGSRERTCSICKYTQTETLPVHTHDVHDEAWKYDKTQHWQECSCGEKLNVANHAYGEWRVTKPATETEEGSKARDCTVCDHVQTETIPMLEHEHGIHDETWKYDKTQHWQECSCGEKLNVANHIYGDWKVTKEATETEVGSRERDCTVCEYVQVEIIPEIGHEHGIHDETWKYDKTQHWQECSCGEKLNVANHTYGDWKVTKEATETEVGSRERGCTVCEYVQVEIIPEIGHEHGIHDETWKYDETDHWQECSCGEKLNVANHTYGDWKVTKEATETEAGSRERGCAVCEYVQTEAIPAAGTGEPTDSTDPTDSSDSQGQQDPSGDTGSPQTGDSSDMALWIGLMLASCGGVLGMLFYRRKKAAAGK